MGFDPDKLLNLLRGLPAAQRYWVAYSGGLDSSVLLQALAQQKSALAGELRALHINHHIHSDSDAWQQHCERCCAQLRVPLECRGVEVSPAKGESLEAVARTARYASYRALLGAGDLLLLAHHQDDQLETFLLQALRGAGLRGLAAMPMLADCGAAQMARPLLGFSREELRKWAEQQRFDWLEDPSNADTRFDRNYLRHVILPPLKQRWPAAAETVSRGARHCGEALELLIGQAAEDWKQCASGDGQTLAVVSLRKLGVPRVKNLLRYWLEKLELPLPPARKLEQVFAEVLAAGADRNPCLSWEGAELRRYRQRLYALAPLPEAPAGEFRLLPGHAQDLGMGLGSLQLQAAEGEGLKAAACPEDGLRVRFRAGGEVCRPAGRAHRRPLKKWLQEFAVLPWMRECLPLIYAGEELAAVAGLFVCAPFAAGRHEPGLRIHWHGHPPLQ
ncbi:MAG: tRNA lysidine(34) synthetase TilS [Gammaproteobacteria bacterium]|nr:tRNA lysidine(34) synthetase TilS [Gammaproteobacteria bacterium]MBU6508823.1 tRNA lysidine(34) synthetase TilS [Gammaproteobacteria bacterium]MDE1983135.1 tRNA lysidine(34) synthetase TilS [Gammaproteobacteria bacterium]MDE2108467.1 tRNA lysidine(34) synthetase TilS [Gammaproteobacteria bacterium]MDE2460161.1 tRNA lysidine(34) synthetase TilS [Gammaproteobacteria bacterium]